MLTFHEAFILVFMAVFSLLMLICSVRVNVVLVVLIFGVFLGFVLVAAALFIENAALLDANAAVALSGTDSAAAEALLSSAVSKRALTLKLVKVNRFVHARTLLC
jgi:succinate-acetate transporter protein